MFQLKEFKKKECTGIFFCVWNLFKTLTLYLFIYTTPVSMMHYELLILYARHNVVYCALLFIIYA